MNECLICCQKNSSKEFEFPLSITSCSRPQNVPIQVLLCGQCGHIFNPPSQLPPNFYEQEYELLLEGQNSEFVIFNQNSQITLFDKVLQFIFSNFGKDINNNLTVLEVGSGKGLLLKRMQEFLNGRAELFAVEPNRKSEPYLRENIGTDSISMTTLEASPFKDKKFDLIISHGVLEHVSEPIAFLKAIYKCMDNNSLLYIGIPNFEANPSDLLTTDHLSKFTTKTSEYLFNSLGFKIVNSHKKENEVFMMYLLKKDGSLLKDNTIIQKENKNYSMKILKTSIKYVENSLKEFENAIFESKKERKKFSIYGAGNIGLLAIKHFNIDKQNIACIYDDNKTFWGTTRMGIPIINPENLKIDQNSVLFVSANPCYYQAIHKKIEHLSSKNASIYPKVPV